MMNGIEWDALPIVAEMVGVENIETFIRQLVAIRDDQNKRSEQS